MSDHTENQENYWKANVRLIFGCLIVWALVSYGFGILLRPMLAGIEVGGTDLGFWFAQQGSIISFIGLVFFYAWRMNALDKEFGLEE
ncbi:MAG: hypothetical protein CMG93_15555 [Marinomonas sp.]|jgi:putative solute:sodium symporter small subunit|uniref:DUF4212 domain-containing protein n=2 Tax=Marinomonas TaxID=28253 RepID=A0ABS0ZCA0_9GAMM|nr:MULTISPECIES: DUF4212 domain-containing protein [Marinomonas]MAF17365.1 hypothetical protein [Marinomonas sp.]MBJ7551257.1 DUF4212 domain-containing protein [Marinomonas ostreistagni]MCC4272922.1 DUF4212 domain-containing protein [Marinomonas communis]RUM52765.1 MAG: DUF4212 domain-containing protein [Marinomonas sp.]TDR15764.1 putative solute:sodium symporter small subunit [Marinomonas communis]